MFFSSGVETVTPQTAHCALELRRLRKTGPKTKENGKFITDRLLM